MSAGDNGMGTSGDAPRISVILPVHNGARTLRETIDSVLAQTFPAFELLVIDDGSTDDTLSILTTIKDPRMTVMSFENRGLSASRNRGIARARGEFIAFIDADDLWVSDKLDRQFRALGDDPRAALAYSWTDCIDDRGRFLKHGSHVRAAGDVYAALVSRNFLDNGSSALVRRAALEAAGPFDETLRGAEDWDMWLRLASRDPFACVPVVQVLYRVHGRSMSSAMDRQIANCRRVLARGLERLPPGPARDRAGRVALAGIYRNTAVRLVETGSDHAAGRTALRYWWHFVTTTPTPVAHAFKALLILGGIMIMLVLPPPLVAAVRNRVIMLAGLRWQGPAPTRTD